jgi:DNA-binding MarR family transcriptional regulator
MDEVFEELASLNRLIHDPSRLAIMTALSSCESADFTFLQRLTGLTQGNLSGHLSRLEEAGLVKADKQFVGRRPNTTLSLTENGRKAIEQHWQRLERLRNAAQKWKKEK